MTSTGELRGFWESAGSAKTFTHPLDEDLLRSRVPYEASILDYGCGYGRLTAELAALGYGRVRGVDFSAALIARGRREHPRAVLEHVERLPLPAADASYDAALLFAVLTCVPEDDAQRAVLAELSRLVRPGGVLYLSDVPLQSDPRNLARYREYEGTYGTYGVFATPDGGVFRHSEPQRLRGLVRAHGFVIEQERTDTVGTLDQHTVERLQIIARRAESARPGAVRD